MVKNKIDKSIIGLILIIAIQILLGMAQIKDGTYVTYIIYFVGIGFIAASSLLFLISTKLEKGKIKNYFTIVALILFIISFLCLLIVFF